MNPTRIVILLLVGAGSLFGEPEQPRRDGKGGAPDGRGGGERSFGHFFETADSNGDGAVSRDEFVALERISKIPSEKQDEIFSRFDKNGDGKIQPGEMRPGRGPGDGKHQMPRLHELDANKDGKVSFEEFGKGPLAKRMPQERLKLLFGRLDTNGDGSISPEDRPKGRGGPRDRRPMHHDRQKMIENLDKNGDKSLSFEEFRQAPWLKEKGEDEQEDAFEALDRNDNLMIDQSDLSPSEKAGPGPRGPGGKGPQQRGAKGPRSPQGPNRTPR
jgi:Ca2+-binding EF-hand superfamily protein